ncbi:PilZ domain-containing protein [Tistlia consotensis]|uniref:PilZ domain-containing protein n=1 Tax=Tistlia consotensis USBA 355 TaxID=560819 RepID=A0A1Y6CN59_9PROT|nr:PilZ domain-containing protein [Tistlia consotensis]SMF79066.1 PilZ domain-containing protein [Tistlia consotensis USBA 355]SNS15732.1 PilZ domain-containing protein [Tistlia consotensis]
MTPAEKFDPELAEQRKSLRYLPDEAIDIDLLTEGRRLRAVVQDVSVRGMKLALPDGCPDGSPVGSPVMLEHPAAGSFRGVCVWSDERAVGIELVEPKREIERVLQCICLLIGLRKPR